MKKNIAGFTLIEILVAMVILAIIGAMMVVGLQSAIRTQNKITVKADRLAAVQSAVVILERDIEQIINRPILATDGRVLPALTLTNADKKQILEFTHAGLINPFAIENRTTMQRVSYSLDGNKLTRTTWAELDRTSNTPSQTGVLLSGVNSFVVTLYYAIANSNVQPPKLETKQSTSNVQEAAPTTTVQSIPLPVAVEVVMDVEGIGTVGRLIPLAG